MRLTLGCDPELICRINGKFVPAEKFFKSNAAFGLDGNKNVAEIRPGYSESPIDLTAKIRILLEHGSSKYPELEFVSGHFVDGYPIGGHIHLSAEPSERLISGLDVVLGALSSCIDERSQIEKRKSAGYGKLSSFRAKSYGMEYRMPGSWLLNPSISLVTFTLAKLTVIGVKEDGLNFRTLKNGWSNCQFLKGLKKKLITIPEDCFEGLLELDFLIENNWKWDQNILPNWGVAA